MTITLIKPVEFKGQTIRSIDLNTDITGHAEKVLLAREPNRAKIMNKFLAMQIALTDPNIEGLNEVEKYSLVKRMSSVDIKRALYALYKDFRDNKMYIDIQYTTKEGVSKSFSGDVELPNLDSTSFSTEPIEFSLSKPLRMFEGEYSDFILYPMTGHFSELINQEENLANINTLFISELVKTKCGKTIPFDIAESLSLKVRNEFRKALDKISDFYPQVTVEDGVDTFDYPLDILDFFT